MPDDTPRDVRDLAEAMAHEWPDFAPPRQHEDPVEGWEDPSLPDFRLIWSTARRYGYAVGLHGSMRRDCDLIAAPWIDAPASADELIAALCADLNARQVGPVEDKPRGRVAVTLQIDGYFKPIDLSILADRASRPAEKMVEAGATNIPADVVALVIAARNVAFGDQPSPEELRSLDKASEAFASRVPWDGDDDAGRSHPHWRQDMSEIPEDVRVEAVARSDAAFDGRNYLTMGRVDRERYSARAKLALEAADRASRPAEKMVEALRKHHEWHLAQGEDSVHGIDMAEAYSESGLCDETVDALKAHDAALASHQEARR